MIGTNKKLELNMVFNSINIIYLFLHLRKERSKLKCTQTSTHPLDFSFKIDLIDIYFLLFYDTSSSYYFISSATFYIILKVEQLIITVYK